MNEQKILIASVVFTLILTSTYLNVFLFKDQSSQITSLIITFIVILCYFKAAFTSPIQSNVDRFFNYNISNRSKGNQIIKINSSMYNKKCDFCNKIKFERSSHCKICNVCVLRRDHHCAWLGNCVGFGNNQYFINFCVWITVSFI